MLLKPILFATLSLYILNVLLFTFLISTSQALPNFVPSEDPYVFKQIDAGTIEVRELLDYVHSAPENTNTNAHNYNSKVHQQVDKRSLVSLVQSTTKSKNKFMQALTSGNEKGTSFFKKIKNRYVPHLAKMKKKVMQSVDRTKAVYNKVRSNKWVNFTVTASSVIWNKIPEETRTEILNKAQGFVVGKAGDIMKGCEKVGFDATTLISDAEVNAIMDGNEGENNLLETEFSGILNSANKKSSDCCCHLDRTTTAEKDITVSADDFNPASLDEEDEEGILNVDPYAGKEFMIEAATQQSSTPVHPVVKREVRRQCGCARNKDSEELVARELKRQEKILQRQTRSVDEQDEAAEDKDGLPPVLMALSHNDAIEILKNANIDQFGKICEDLNKPSPSCLSFEGVRVGALAELLTLRLLCPVCKIKILSAVGSYAEPLIDGWNFILEDDITLGGYITSALKTYPGHTNYYDQGKNQFTLICENEEDILRSDCVWNFFTHV